MKQTRGKTIEISVQFDNLLVYVTKHRNMRSYTNKGLTVEDLILAYAKQLVAGMPKAEWREHAMRLVKEAEADREIRNINAGRKQ